MSTDPYIHSFAEWRRCIHKVPDYIPDEQVDAYISKKWCEITYRNRKRRIEGETNGK